MATADTRLVPVAALAWVGAWLGTRDALSGLAIATCAVVAALALGAAARRSRWSLLAALLALVSVFAVGWLRHEALVSGPVAQWAEHSAASQVEGTVKSDPVHDPAAGTRPERTRFELAVTSVTARGRRVACDATLTVMASADLAGPAVHVQVGQRVQLSGLLQQRDPGSSDVAALRLRAVPVTLQRPGFLDRQVNDLRAGLRSAMRWSPPAQRQLVPSLVVGDRGVVPDSMATSFKSTALTHLMAVSGTNLALALAFVLGVARAVGAPRRLLHLIALATVAGFVVVCRGEPSVVRAAAMGLVTLAAVGPGLAGRRGVRHLSVAVTGLLLFDPWLARTLGFELSVAATAGIIWWGSPWQQALARWCPGWLAEALAVPLAAQVATQPLVTSISGGVSMVGLLANALAGPFVGPTTVTGLVAMAMQQLPGPLGAALGWVAGWCAQPILTIADRGSRVPGAVWPWPSSPVSLALLAVACWLAARTMPVLIRHRWGWIPLALVALVVPFTRPVQVGWPGAWQIVFCDVGQGDATLVRTGRTAAVLIDVGPETSAAHDCVRALGITQLPLVVLTHYHADHSGGLAAVAASTPIGQVVDNPVASPQADVSRVRRVLAAHRIAERTASVGEQYRVGSVTIDLVGGGALPGVVIGAGEGESSAENDTSLAMLVRVGGLSLLVAGDAEPAEQQSLVDRNAEVAAQVFKMPHHGSARQLPQLWQRTGAALALASAGLHNDYGHPAPNALKLAARLGMTVARTDLEGGVAVWFDGARLQVRTQRAPPP